MRETGIFIYFYSHRFVKLCYHFQVLITKDQSFSLRTPFYVSCLYGSYLFILPLDNSNYENVIGGTSHF